jgi:hypothetical protein
MNVPAPSNKRLKLAARRLGNESFFSAPQLKRDPLGGSPQAGFCGDRGVTVVAAWAVAPQLHAGALSPVRSRRGVFTGNGLLRPEPASRRQTT